MENPSKKSKTQAMQQRVDEPPAAVRVPHLPEDMVTEILFRLPGESVLRAAAVSRAWRRITTDPAFVASHARRRPLQILLLKTVLTRDHPDDVHTTRDAAVDTIAVSTDQAGRHRRLICYSLDPYPMHYSVVASSCDGVLLLKINFGRTYHICNPVTRQWTELPRLPETSRRSGVLEYGFYHHQPSGEYRLLCRCSMRTARAHVHYILSTGATEPRVLSLADVDKAAAVVTKEIVRFYKPAPVALHGRLHWLPLVSNMLNMVAFDTTSERFHLMTLPPSDVTVRTILFAMDGLLVAAQFGDMRISLWFLEDYGAGSERWECRHQVANPPTLERQLRAHGTTWSWRDSVRIAITGTDVEGDIILGSNQGVVAYNVKTKMWRVTEAGDMNSMLCHSFRESLVQHQCFKERPSDGLPLIKFS